jgi:hypothetical protein
MDEEGYWNSQIAGTSPSHSLRYELALNAWYGGIHKNPEQDVWVQYPRFWQSPVVEDVTITYLGPVTFLNWR